jgi:hypothetical protein
MLKIRNVHRRQETATARVRMSYLEDDDGGNERD